MGYTTDDSIVRVDFFKPDGKWYTTEAIQWIGYRYIDILDAFENSLKESIGNKFSGMTAVCLNPYHEHSHPVSMVIK